MQETLAPADLKKAIAKAKREAPELEFAQQLMASRLLPYVPQWKFHPTRLWRWDFGFPDIGFAVDIQGGIFVRGAHSRGLGQENDYEKMAEAAVLGITCIHVSPGQVKRGEALHWVEQIVRARRSPKPA